MIQQVFIGSTPEIRHRITSANKLTKIIDVSAAHDWNYITSAEKPVDNGSRGYQVKPMNSSSRSLNGPNLTLTERWLAKSGQLESTKPERLHRSCVANRSALSKEKSH